MLVLLSGGRDSVCLLDKLRWPALHVNYGLRPEADADEAFCRELCERLGVELHLHRADEPTGNLQAWARDVRYAVALELTDGDVATGHTATDQVEGVLYRLAASPGRRALLGMREREGRVVRPLLGMTREDTAAYCRERDLPWIEDASNADPRFARNRARADLIPALRALHPAAEANVLATIEILRAEAEVLDGLVAEFLRGRTSVPAAELRALPEVAAAAGVHRARRRARRAPGRRGRRTRARGGPRRVRTACRRPGRRDRDTFSDLSFHDPAIGETIIQADELQHRIAELGAQITEDYEGRELLLVCVLKGAVFFLSDLMRHIDLPCEVDFMAVASYGSATESSGVVRILKDLDMAIENRDVLVVEDIVDSGLTLQYLLRSLQTRNPASLEVCALLTKPSRRAVEGEQARYIGFEIPDKFAVGYGLDHAERYRNLPYVAALASS